MLKQPVNITYALLFLVLSMLSCTQEEAEKSSPSESIMPVHITALRRDFVDNAMKTRVTDSEDGTAVGSMWTAGDKISVAITPLAEGETAWMACELNADGSVRSYEPQLLWKNTGRYVVNAWYSNIINNPTTENTIDISNQTERLAYVMKAEQEEYIYYPKKRDDISLKFVHQLAKVRVKLTDGGNGNVDFTGAQVRIRDCYTTCTISSGVITPQGKSNGKVTMMPPTAANPYFEANVIPDEAGTERRKYALEVTLNGRTQTVDLAQTVTLEAGKAYTLNITYRE